MTGCGHSGCGARRLVGALHRRQVETAAARAHLPPEIPEHRLAMADLSLVGAMGIVVLEWLDGGLDATVDEIAAYFVDMLLAAAAAAG